MDVLRVDGIAPFRQAHIVDALLDLVQLLLVFADGQPAHACLLISSLSRDADRHCAIYQSTRLLLV